MQRVFLAEIREKRSRLCSSLFGQNVALDSSAEEPEDDVQSWQQGTKKTSKHVFGI